MYVAKVQLYYKNKYFVSIFGKSTKNISAKWMNMYRVLGKQKQSVPRQLVNPYGAGILPVLVFNYQILSRRIQKSCKIASTSFDLEIDSSMRTNRFWYMYVLTFFFFNTLATHTTHEKFQIQNTGTLVKIYL